MTSTSPEAQLPNHTALRPRARLPKAALATGLALALFGATPAVAAETEDPNVEDSDSTEEAEETGDDGEISDEQDTEAEPDGGTEDDLEDDGDAEDTNGDEDADGSELPEDTDEAEVSDEAESEELEIAEIVAALDHHEETGDIPVTTRGVVTAVYPDDRSFNGFYLQTEGTGGTLDPGEQEISDAIFVYSPWTIEDDAVEPGDYVELTGDATVYDANGQRQISLFPGSDQTPHHDLFVIEDEEFVPVEPAEITVPESSEERDALLGMLLAPQGNYTITDHYTLNRFGEIGIVAGDDPLINPTSVVAPGTPANELAAQNQERLIYLDDGATNDFQTSDLELPYITADDPVRIGASVAFETPVILGYDFGEYRLHPLDRLDGPEDPATPASFENTRAGNESPAAPNGDFRIAAFNVLNYFVHLGQDEPGCDFYPDRQGNPTTADWCDVRGAWSQEAFDRQEAKLVSAINAMDADMVALQEVENSGHFHPEGDRDYAHARLVEALNEDLGDETWAYVEEPAEVPDLEDEDVIRNGYIYKPDVLEVVDSWILVEEGIEGLNSAHFADLDRNLADIYSNAREPFAVEFQPVEGTEEDRFIAMVNHFKSKGASGVEDDDPNADQNDGQSPWNYDRIYQAQGVQAFADALAEETGTDQIHLLGDFNSYEMEDPLQVFLNEGYTNLSAAADGYTYMFSGEVGSLDHLISSPAATETVTQTEIWQINAVEPIALEYSRHNYTASDIFRMDQWRSSDHDPIIADIALTGEDTASPAPTETPTETTLPETASPEPTQAPSPTEAAETPEETAEPSPSPEDPESPAATGGEDDTGSLARTGATIAGVFVLALVLMGVGALVLALRSRNELDRLN